MEELSSTKRVVFALLVNIIGGLLVGYAIGYVPVALTFHSDISNCSKYTKPAACASQPKICEWKPLGDSGRCGFLNEPQPFGCAIALNKGDCTALNNCQWQAQGDYCRMADEWSSVQTGVYAGMMIIGGMFGSFAATPLLARLGRKKLLLLTAVTGVVSTLLLIAGWQANSENKLGNYGAMITGPLGAGIAVGFASVVCPMYCGEMAPPDKASVLGVLFQVSVTFGIFLASLVGFFINLSFDKAVDAHMQARFQAMDALSLLFAVAMAVVALIVAEPVPDQVANVQDETAGLVGASDSTIPLSNLKTNFIIAIALAAAQQLTGINAVMNYAPQITKNFIPDPLTGNMVIMAWNFVTTLAAIKIASMFSTGGMYVTSAFVASVACVVTAIPIFPSVAPTESAGPQAVVGLGIFVFVAAFEMGMGPAFYVLAQSIFPASRRGFGCSFTVVVQFVFNLIINFCFPIAVEGLSGGPDADQRLGMACVFVFFGVIGIVCTSVLAWSLRKSSKSVDADEAYA